MERRLAAVMIADVAGYGRLSQVDEEGTRARFQADLREIFEPKIAAHHGRLVKTMGDGVLVEFRSVVDALRCAIEVQRAEAERNAGIQTDRRLEFRFGINLGDVIVEGDDIHGDGVNIADRLQALAEPGGVVISGTAYDQVRTKVAVGYADLGEQRVKNIADPVRMYRVLTSPEAVGRTIGERRPVGRPWRRPAAVAAVLVLVVGTAATAWWRPWVPAIEPASIERMALPLPDKPSIAVLPFANMSDDPKQEYFADGITDDLITELSKVSGLFVIARNSSFNYKGKAVKIAQVAEELGVRYVLEGSVQRAGDRVRINAQLIDALNGGHVWAERFDGSLADVFALQDKVTNATADALAVRLTTTQQASIAQRETSVPAAYDAFLRGWEHYRRTTPADYAKAIPYFEEAIKLDPNYYRAYAALAMVYVRSSARNWTGSLGITGVVADTRANRYLREAQKQPSALAHQVSGYIQLTRSCAPSIEAIPKFKDAIVLDPSDSWSYAFAAFTLTSDGRPAEATPYIDAAMRLDPHPPPLFMYYLGITQFNMEQFDEAVASLESATRLNRDDQYSFLALAATYGHLGRKEDASAAIARYNELEVAQGGVPATVSTRADLYPPCKSQEAQRFRTGLSLAGAPESLLRSEFAEQNKLSADEARTLVFGHRLHGRSLVTGVERAASVTTDGVGQMSGDWVLGVLPLTGGIAEFKDDELCLKFTVQNQCGIVFRNPGGTRANENEYFWYMTGDRAFPFSRVE